MDQTKVQTDLLRIPMSVGQVLGEAKVALSEQGMEHSVLSHTPASGLQEGWGVRYGMRTIQKSQVLIQGRGTPVFCGNNNLGCHLKSLLQVMEAAMCLSGSSLPCEVALGRLLSD